MNVPMTHSIAYNASKGAAGIMTRQMARELQREHGICVFGICPNKLAGTNMSKYIENRVVELRGWTPEQAEKYQLQALLAGQETQPDQVAELLVWLLSKPRRHKYLTGCLLELGL
jgi:NAD(P)-dependent dehydrogenase (short-subunit alcohol dehydrogenase family)